MRVGKTMRRKDHFRVIRSQSHWEEFAGLFGRLEEEKEKEKKKKKEELRERIVYRAIV